MSSKRPIKPCVKLSIPINSRVAPRKPKESLELVNVSYAVLIDPVKRAGHNAWIREQEAKAKQQSEKAPFNDTGKATEQQRHRQQQQDTQPPPSSTDSEAMFQRAYDLNDRGRHAEAFSLYRQLAEQGHAKAQFNLGVMYDQGQYVTQDYAEAVSWYSRQPNKARKPALTTISSMAHTLGRVAARLALQRIADPGRPIEHIILDAPLIIRESCGTRLGPRRD